MPTKKTTKKTTSKKVTKKAAAKTPKKATAAKAAVTKTKAKKTVTTSRPVSKKAKTRALVCASDDQCFWTTDGRVLAHLEDLELAFGSMDESVFLYHANSEKNDFSEWVEHVLEDAALAAALRRSKKPHTAAKTVRTHIRNNYNDTI